MGMWIVLNGADGQNSSGAQSGARGVAGAQAFGSSEVRKGQRVRKDFPYYLGAPAAISFGQWGLLFLSVASGYLILLWMPPVTAAAQLLARLLFVGIPLGTLAWIVGRDYKAIWGPVGWREAMVAVLGAISAIALSVAAAWLVSQFSTVSANTLAVAAADMPLLGFVWQLLSMVPQLLGEELLTILPFLATLQLASSRLGLGRKAGVLLALVVSTSVFSAAHLPTYDWNWLQCFGVIAAARVALTLVYVATRNLWVSAGAHVLTDWTEFTLAFVFAKGFAASA